MLQLGVPGVYTLLRLMTRPHGQLTPQDRETEAGSGFDRLELTDGEVTDDEVSTNVFPILFRTYRYPWFSQRIIQASSPMNMMAQRWCVMVLWPSPVTAWPGEHDYGIYKP